LGWCSDQVLDNAHFDNERKFNFYQAMDRVEKTRFINAIPLGLDKKVTQKARKNANKAINDLDKFIRVPITKSDENEELNDLFKDKGGFERFMRDMKDGKVKMRQLPISRFGSGM